MITDNLLFKFLKEIFTRLTAKSPVFFQVWQWVSGVALAITGLPDFLKLLSITVPDAWMGLENKFVAIASGVAFFMSAMTTQSKVTGVDQAGNPIKQTDPKKLPFTTVQEKKSNKP